MEHYRSTLGFAAFAACSLVAAGHILHPGNYETQTRTRRVVRVTAEAPSSPSSLINPSVTLRGVEPAALQTDSAAILAPRLTVALPRDALTAPSLPSALVTPASAVRKAKADPIGELIHTLGDDG